MVHRLLLWLVLVLLVLPLSGLLGRWPSSQAPGNAGLEAFCKAGGKGIGYNATTGLYDATCVTGWDTAGYFDYQDCTAAGTPDHACYENGERVLVDGIVHAYYAAAEKTQPGGTVWFPQFPGHDSGLYVYRGCGAHDCPTFEQDLDDVSLRPAYRVRNITAYKGLHLRGLTGDQDGAFNGGRKGVYLLHDAGQNANLGAGEKTDGDGQGLGSWVFRLGPITGVNICYSTDNGGGNYSNDCDFDYVLSVDSPVSGRMGRYIYHAAHCTGGAHAGDFCDIQADCTDGGGVCDFDIKPTFATVDGSGVTQVCFFNDTTFAEQAGVCDGDVRVLCNGNGADRTSEVTGGCDFSNETPPGDDLGTCVAMMDSIEDLQDAGEQIIIGCTAHNFDIDGTEGEGQTTAYFPVLDVAGTCGDGNSGRYLLLGNDTTHDGSWPFYRVFDYPDDMYCNVMNTSWLDNGNMFNYQGLEISPVDYYGRPHPGTCTVGDEDTCGCVDGDEYQCDSAPMIGILGGTNGGMYDVGISGCSNDGNMSCIDGSPDALYVKMQKLKIRDGKRGLIADASDWLFDDVDIDRVSTYGANSVFAVFSSTSRFQNIRVGNTAAGSFIKTLNGSGFLADTITFRGGCDFIYGAYNIQGGHGIRITNNLVESMNGRFALISAGTGFVTSDVTIDHNTAYGGPNIPSQSVSGTQARAWIAVSDVNENNQGEIRNVWIQNNSVIFDNYSDACGIYFDIGDDHISGGVGRDDIGVEDYIHEFTLTGNSVRGTIAEFTCAGDDGSLSYDKASETLRVWALNRLPYMEGNILNDVAEPDYKYHQMSYSDAPDSDDMPAGVSVGLYDDDGSCGDTNGVLDGGAVMNACCTNGSGDWVVCY